MKIRWAAQYRDGSVVNQFGPDGKEVSTDNLINRAEIEAFGLWDFETRKPILTLHLDPGQKLIYRRRCWQRVGEEKPHLVVYLVGWRRTVAGECIQSIAYVFEETGHVELAGRFREDHPIFDSPKLRLFEE
jgi:hypothetical protein